MKATLTFNLDDPDDKMAHYRCVRALDMALTLFQLQSMRKSIEYKIESKSLDPYETLEAVLDEIQDTINQNHLIIDDLIA